ncbi:MAG: hypothetical protein AAGE88_23940 [Actinomycetota bacterium]
MLTTTFVGALGVSWAGLAPGPMAWFITAGCAAFGCTPLVAYAARARSRRRRLVTGRLPVEGDAAVRAAADHANRLHDLARSAPPGPVAEELLRVADIADEYVRALHAALDAPVPAPTALPTTSALRTGGSADNGLRPTAARGATGPLQGEAERIVGQLAEAVDAAEELRQIQRDHLERSTLTEATERLRTLSETLEGA